MHSDYIWNGKIIKRGTGEVTQAAMEEMKSMERMSDMALLVVINACASGGNRQKKEIAETILKRRNKKGEVN